MMLKLFKFITSRHITKLFSSMMIKYGTCLLLRADVMYRRLSWRHWHRTHTYMTICLLLLLYECIVVRWLYLWHLWLWYTIGFHDLFQILIHLIQLYYLWILILWLSWTWNWYTDRNWILDLIPLGTIYWNLIWLSIHLSTHKEILCLWLWQRARLIIRLTILSQSRSIICSRLSSLRVTYSWCLLLLCLRKAQRLLAFSFFLIRRHCLLSWR